MATTQTKKGRGADTHTTPTTRANDTAGRQLVVADFNGDPVEFDSAGWFNATKTAKHFFKLQGDALREFKHYTAQRGVVARQTRHLILWPERGAMRHAKIETLREVIFRSEEITLLKVERGGRGKGGVTWMHPKLAVEFARWLHAAFGLGFDELLTCGGTA